MLCLDLFDDIGLGLGRVEAKNITQESVKLAINLRFMWIRVVFIGNLLLAYKHKRSIHKFKQKNKNNFN